MSGRSEPDRLRKKSQRRSKLDLTPITDQEIFGAAGMSGSQIGFLRNITPGTLNGSVHSVSVGSDSVPTVPLQSQPVETGAVDSEDRPIDEVVSDPVYTATALPFPGPRSGTAASGTVAGDAVPTGSVDSRLEASTSVPTVPVGTDPVLTQSVPTHVLCGSHPSQRRTPVPCTTVAHGHTQAEHTVYEFLWRAAGKWGRSESDSTRLLRFKQQWLADVLGMHENSIRSILKSLMRKLALEETSKAGPAQGREIRIHSQAATLDRRRRAGLTWAVRSHGVTLLTAEDLYSMTDTGLSVGTDIVSTDPMDSDLISLLPHRFQR